MNETLSIRLKVYKYTIIAMCIISVLMVLLLEDGVAWVYGLVFGTLISLLNFTLLAKTMEKAVHMPPEKAKMYAGSQYFMRYIIYAIVIFIAIKAPYMHILGTIIGLLLIKGVILATNLFNDKNYYKNIFRRKEDN